MSGRPRKSRKPASSNESSEENSNAQLGRSVESNESNECEDNDVNSDSSTPSSVSTSSSATSSSNATSSSSVEDTIRSYCIALAEVNGVDEKLEETVLQRSEEQPDPVYWYLRKMLYIISISSNASVDLTTCLVDKNNWSEQLATNLPREKTFIKICSKDRIPSILKNHDVVSVIKRRYRNLGLDHDVVEDIVHGILCYSHFVAVEAGVPVTFDNVEMRKIIRTKHLMILASFENNMGLDNLLDTVSEHKLDGFDLAFMTRRQLLPKYHAKIMEDQVKRQAGEDASILDPKDMEDGFYECDRCGQKKTTFESRQIRSADEPATTFITCHVCRTVWKEN